MARAYCPSCGKRYNGKRCSNCLYENFTEEIAHGLHTHEGEPLVIKAPARQPVPRKDPFDCDKKTRKPPVRRKAAAVVIPLVIIVVLVAALNGLFFLVSRTERVFSGFAPETQTEPALPTGGTVLYDAGGILVVADWQDGQEYGDGIRVVVQNGTDRDFTLSSRDMIVNGYVLRDSLLYCQVQQGHTAQCWLRLDQDDLDNAGIETVQTLSLALAVYDSESYETLAETDFLPLCTTGELSQPVDDSGVPLFQQDGIRVVYRGYVPSEYAPDTLTDGTLQFFLENNTEQYLNYYTTECQVNGQRVMLSLWCALPPHTRAVSSMYLYDLEELELLSWEDITELTLQLEFSEHNEYDLFLQTGTLALPLGGEIPQ